MSLIFGFIMAAGAVFLGVYLAIVSSPNKLIIWISCGIIFISGVCKLVINIRERKKRKKKEKKDETKEEYYQIKAERRELVDRDLPMEYIDGLGDHPELRHYLNSAEKLEDANKYNEAIEEYKKCLSHPRATNDNKVAANILMGNCYYNISQLTEAENNYRQALIISKKVKDKNERLKGKASGLGNIGLIYRDKGELDKALKYLEDALKINREIGYKQGEANQLANIGLIYPAKGELDEAMKYLEDALKIHREIGSRQGEANQLGNIGLIYRDKGELDKALKLIEDALKINREIGSRQGEANQLANIGLIYTYKGELDEALKYHKDALKMDREIGYKQSEAIELGNIGLIYRDKEELDKALKYLEDALKILDKYNLQYGRDIIQRAVDDIEKKK